MYFVISRLDASKLANLDSLMNFGVSIDVRSIILELIENGGNYEDCCHSFELIPFS